MLTLHRLNLLALVATLGACGPDPVDTGTSATTDGTGTSDASPTSTTDATDAAPTSTTDDTGTTGEPPPALCPEHTTVDACCCFEAFMGFSGSVKNVCGTQSLCAAAEFECNQIDESCTTKDEAAVDCTLAALADGKMVGSLVIDIDIDNNYGRRHIEVYLQGDATAYVTDQDVLDLTGYNDVTGRYTLREPAHFETCLASMDLQAKVACLQDVVEGEASEVCIEGFGYQV